jgi:hypothetical protein
MTATITMTSAELRALEWAREVLDAAMEYPRSGYGWPHYNANEAAADAIIRAAGMGYLIDGEYSPLEQAMDGPAREWKTREASRLRDLQLAAEREARAKREAEAEAAALARVRKQVSREASRYPVMLTGVVQYLGGGEYGLRCDRAIRASKQVAVRSLGPADKGRTVTVRVEQFTESVA